MHWVRLTIPLTERVPRRPRSTAGEIFSAFWFLPLGLGLLYVQAVALR